MSADEFLDETRAIIRAMDSTVGRMVDEVLLHDLERDLVAACPGATEANCELTPEHSLSCLVRLTNGATLEAVVGPR